MTFRIDHPEWLGREFNHRLFGGVAFRVYQGDESLYRVVVGLGAGLADEILLHAGVDDDQDGRNRLRQALIRFAVRRIEAGLRESFLPTVATQEQQEVDVMPEDSSELVGYLNLKNCAYQHEDGRELFCSAAGQKDRTAVALVGLRTFAPTSRALCLACNLPDTDYICSHLRHPVVLSEPSSGKREVVSALCDLNRPEISAPSKCRAGGNPCWQRRVDPAENRLTIPLAPTAVSDALELLDATWERTFRRPLFRPQPPGSEASLALGCHSRADFQSRMSTLADRLKSMEIGDDLIPSTSGIPKDQTLKRLLAALKERLPQDETAEVERGIAILRDVNDVRRALEHTGARSELPGAFAKLQVRLTENWNDNWDAIRAKTVEAMALLRNAVRTIPAPTPSVKQP